MKFTCLEVVTAAGLEGRRRGKEQMFSCPRHEDQHPSLMVNAEKDTWMCGPCGQHGTAWQLAAFLNGHDAADKDAVTAWLRDHELLGGNGHRDRPAATATASNNGTRARSKTRDDPPGRLVATYDYRNASGELVYQSVRYEPKAFRRRRPNGNGGWLWNLEGVRLVPYALDRLVDRTPEVFVVEGEKDCETLWSAHTPATCNIGGAGKWLDAYSEQLKTAAGVERAYVLPDHDRPGHRHAPQVAASLHRVGIEVRIVLLPGLHDGAPAPAHGRDISNWLETHALADLRTQAAAAPRWTPSPEAPAASAAGLDPALLDDVTVVVKEGQQIARDGVPYVVDGLIPALGMVGAHVAYAKVGKTTAGQQLAGAVACGALFLDRATRQARVLILAAEDPPEYTAYLARHLIAVPAGQLTFYRHPIQLDAAGLAQIVATVQAGGYGLVLIASWQSVVATLIRDENDNAGAVKVMEAVKAAARATGIPWLIDAHSGKGEDQRDDADPTRALRGASGAAGAADFILSLRYADGPFSPRRRLNGKGRFVSVPPILMEFDAETGAYTALGDTKTATVETTWRLIVETGALTTTPQTVDMIAQTAGLVPAGKRCSGHTRRLVAQALFRRDGVDRSVKMRGARTITLFSQSEGA
jgi:hypothetical protein